MATNENTLTRPIFELGMCSLHKNGIEFEFDQDYNGNQCDLECDLTNIYTNEARIDVIRKINIISG